MQENAQRITKVWLAFVKFIKSQVMINGRLVDTGLIGLFFLDSRREVTFMPSPEFLEAGKFKL